MPAPRLNGAGLTNRCSKAYNQPEMQASAADIIGIVKVSTAAREVDVVSCANAVQMLNTATVSTPPMATAGQAARCGHKGRRRSIARPNNSTTPAPKPRPRAAPS